ncbi:hypothetical protein E1A91_A10G124200v1 [Gossypium mustelinum]|uniref:Uncharacterized protein n=2 Tax=Gossypium TaxID=3633 RepID=A0A5D2XNG1_GOSMU|nr:hypothetical protein E1A91_A10G124200v1 [Gossypium mustelinum]
MWHMTSVWLETHQPQPRSKTQNKKGKFKTKNNKLTQSEMNWPPFMLSNNLKNIVVGYSSPRQKPQKLSSLNIPFSLSFRSQRLQSISGQ